MLPSVKLDLSGERFTVVYRARYDGTDPWEVARHIAVEQTVEFPADLVPEGDIRDHVVGRIEAMEVVDERHVDVTVSYAVEITSFELPQLLNVVYGNISMRAGVRVVRLDVSERLLTAFRGPRFGRDGLRDLLGVPDRPLLCTAIKPMGLSSRELADLAYRFALGGIDIVKDDHGLTDQPFAPFAERVPRCAEAVARANRETGRRCLYVPNVTAPFEKMLERAQLAKAVGAGGLLVAPGIIGFDAMRRLADDALGLPVMSHPAFLGSLIALPEHGIAPAVLFGQIARLAGADAVVFANHGGRFAFRREDCDGIVRQALAPMGPIKPSLPTAGGGMTLETVGEVCRSYGPDIVVLVGGGLHQAGPDLVESCRAFHRCVSEALASPSA
jgi:ribulose-bisphosphate carboxylase large chain